ncbi:Zinc finger, FYVE/PHD-type [Plasmopara halstedii]|uniref:Zinc finger, FYVE/PHD-type n=1 Tax=Plasmopara halstedii TaxID=4781 RepID=A0A0P1ARD8_PLAHL|nr:Zinc finger, FYVE/PHD-type [Plasmopara halstedii]CEG44113.1 Zinc finger, FYVE/PHD-type [Plasmopara halstedii]|eukprot:XP_024580482.1 Zinc finger, FYVE/PHD-type [Plasmopara halstedii]
MAKFNVHDVAIPDIKLSPEREASLIAEVEALVQSTLELRSAFAANGRQLDTSAWKLVRTKDDVRAYRSRRTLHGSDPSSDTSDAVSSSSSSSSRTNTSKTTIDNDRPRAKKTRPPAVVLSGTVDGTAEDAVLGMLADSEQHCMMRQSYLGTELEDSRLLLVLAKPTPQNPFTFIGVKWGRQTYGRFSQPRDFVFLESTGITKDSRGEMVSYGLRQSTDLSDVLTLPRTDDVLHGHLSVCQTFANSGVPVTGSRHHSVEMFSRAYLQLDGDVPVNVAASAFAEKIMALVNTMECATAYKLTWMMKQSTRQARPIISVPGSSGHCANCTRSLSKLTSYLLSRGGTCQVCRRSYCGKCSVYKKISIGIGNEVMQKSMLFCLECLLEAKQISARKVAVEQQKY